MTDHPHTSPTPSRPGHHRAVRGGLGHGGPAGAHLARPAPAAPAHVSEDGGGVGARPRTAGSQPGQHHDVERGAAAFEEECFADGMPVVFQVRVEERTRARARSWRAGVREHASFFSTAPFPPAHLGPCYPPRASKHGWA